MEDEDEVDKRNGVQKAYTMKSKDEEDGDEDKRNWGRRGYGLQKEQEVYRMNG